jgi:DNA polymerase III subunit delta'
VADFEEAHVIESDISELGQEADRFQAFPAPREMLWLGGHQAQERVLLDAYRSGKLHHAWLFTGPEGIGKATLAYRFARFILANPDQSPPQLQAAKTLFVPARNDIAGQVARLSHSDLGVIRRGMTKDGKNLQQEISVEIVRDTLSLFKTTAGAGGWRIIVVDAADDLNRASANALLKMLEEPPEKALFMLIAQRPGSLLPTIRSRCRVLRFYALSEAIVAEGLTKLTDTQGVMLRDAVQGSHGSMRDGLALLDPESASFRRDARKILDNLNASNAKAIRQLIEKTTGRPGQKAFLALLEMITDQLHRGLRMTNSDQARLAARADLWEKLRRTARDVETYNLDRRPFLLSLFSELADIERQAAQ